MFTAKVSGRSKSATLKIAIALLSVLFLVIPGTGLLSIDLSQASGDGWDDDWGNDHDNLWKGPKFCSQTAKVVFKACGNELEDDFLIATANCINVSDKDEREECRTDAREERKEGKALCKEKLGARLDLCDSVGEKRYDPDIDPNDFVDPAKIGDTEKANPYFPLVPGYRWTYETRDENGKITETIIVEVLAGESIEIEGVTCAVVRDIVYEGDEINPENIKENTYDWYGQQDDGTVWYFGESSLAKEDCEPEELCEGLLTEDGSWKSGYEGGKAGIIMFGDPSAEVGTVFRQELSLGNAEDAGEVLSVTASPDPQVIDFSCTADCVQTRDFSPLEPDVEENKYYKFGVGVILEVGFEDGVPTGERVELISGPTP